MPLMAASRRASGVDIASAMRDALDESLQTYHAQMNEASGHDAHILPTLGLDASVAAEASTRANSLLKAADRAAKMQAMRDLVRTLPADYRKALFEKSMAMRS